MAGDEVLEGRPAPLIYQEITNANEGSEGIRQNPGRAAASARSYWISTANDVLGYIPEVALTPASRGSLAYRNARPRCQRHPPRRRPS